MLAHSLLDTAVADMIPIPRPRAESVKLCAYLLDTTWEHRALSRPDQCMIVSTKSIAVNKSGAAFCKDDSEEEIDLAAFAECGEVVSKSKACDMEFGQADPDVQYVH